jgi:IS5 family transposase
LKWIKVIELTKQNYTETVGNQVKIIKQIKEFPKIGLERYVGLQKTHTQHVLLAIAYNLKRSPGIVISNSL